LIEKPSMEPIEGPVAERSDKRVQVALPLRITSWDSLSRPCQELACTYDISPRGARITGLRNVQEAGEIIAVERGRSKFFCRIAWIGDASSQRLGQIGIQCIEVDRAMWESELRDMNQFYDQIRGDRRDDNRGWNFNGIQNNRRRAERFGVEGWAELCKDAEGLSAKGQLRDLSEFGCLVLAQEPEILVPGMNLDLALQVANHTLNFRGEVKHAASNAGTGIAFRHVRRVDRQTFRFLLRKLAEQQFEQSFEFQP